MLSKIKSSSLAEARNSSLSHTSNHASDNEDELIDNDTNNNNNNNINNNQQRKKTQDELLEIVEISRKRRLSKDSADSLTSFIRWSFSHIDPSIKRFDNSNRLNHLHNHHQQHHNLHNNNNNNNINNNNNNNNVKFERNTHRDSPATPPLDDDETDMLDDRDEDWRQELTEQMMLRHHHHHPKLSSGSGGGSSAANLALLDNDRHSLGGSGSLTIVDEVSRGLKRPRKQTHSPDYKFSHSSSLAGENNNRKASSSLGNVVDRLHQQQLQQQQQQQLERSQHEMEHEEPGSGGLSYHLQQFLQQQTSLEDLCSSVGLDDSNQLVLAAAIHRALVDSVAPGQNLGSSGGAGGVADGTKSTASSSTGSSSSTGGSSKATNNNNNNIHSNNLNQLSDSNTSGANSRLMDHTLDNHRRAYNTRAALHGITPTTVNRPQANATTPTTATSNNSLSNSAISNRAQQQRHAQAAAALSALANAGSHSLHSLTGPTATTPIVDFTCDTCSSSFDDRHRLMQHQSIHLELKKDWFTETPVDEVMKIFNRRRGEFLCNTCNLRFEATFDYDKHNHSVHGQRPYCCQFCGNGTRTFRFWRQYLNHLYDHRYIFSCTIDDCDFTVNRRDSLRFHIFRFHLNCQLPQNQQHQQQQLRFGHNMLLGNNNNNCDSK